MSLLQKSILRNLLPTAFFYFIFSFFLFFSFLAPVPVDWLAGWFSCVGFLIFIYFYFILLFYFLLFLSGFISILLIYYIICRHSCHSLYFYGLFYVCFHPLIAYSMLIDEIIAFFWWPDEFQPDPTLGQFGGATRAGWRWRCWDQFRRSIC